MSVGDISYNYPASSRVLRREREPGVGKLSWHGNFWYGIWKELLLLLLLFNLL